MFEAIPTELKERPQWVCVQADSKVPLSPVTGRSASSADRSTWGSYEQALQMIKSGRADNLGFVFNDDYIGIDLDENVFDGDDFLTPFAAKFLALCESYTEISRSGRGIHIILKGRLPFRGRNNLHGVEAYQSGRYFIMTGNAIVYRNIITNQEAIDYVVETFFQTGERDGEPKSTGTRIYSPIWEKPENGRIRLRPVYPRITPGSRNTCLTSLAGLLHNQGYEKEQIYDELLYANKVACDPMLPINEIQTIVSSVTRYKR